MEKYILTKEREKEKQMEKEESDKEKKIKIGYNKVIIEGQEWRWNYLVENWKK